MSWIDETLNTGLRQQWLDAFTQSVNMWRAEGFHDVEIYNIMYGVSNENAMWPLFEYWCEIFLDWDDEPKVEV